MISSHSLSQKYKNELITNGIVRIPDFLTATFASELKTNVQGLSFNKAVVLNGKPVELTKDILKGFTKDDYQSMNNQIALSASQGVGFIYGRCNINEDSPSVFGRLLESLNSHSFINFLESTSNEKIKSLDCQATEYRHGDFLTRHNDISVIEKRIYAYAISLSEYWHSDWGGALHFLDKNGSITNSLLPEYNSITIFNVEKIHSVSYITPFAQRPRYSLTGWFKG